MQSELLFCHLEEEDVNLSICFLIFLKIWTSPAVLTFTYQWLLYYSTKWKAFNSGNYYYSSRPSLQKVNVYVPLLMVLVKDFPTVLKHEYIAQ